MVTFLKYLGRKRAHFVAWNLERVVRQDLGIQNSLKLTMLRRLIR